MDPGRARTAPGAAYPGAGSGGLAAGEDAEVAGYGVVRELAPDWACEVLSPGTARKDRVKKMPIYAGNGVGHLWLLDPDQRTLEKSTRMPAATGCCSGFSKTRTKWLSSLSTPSRSISAGCGRIETSVTLNKAVE